MALFLDHFPVFAEAPDGVASLREKILQLAVMGKLVPRDPGDEPASVLLEKIRKEKAQLIKAGKIKESKPLPPIKKEEIPYELPKGWVWVRIRDICHDWGQKKPDKEFIYVDVASIDQKKGIISNNTQLLAPENAPSRARKIVKKDTVIYSTVRPYLLNIAIIEKHFEPEPIASTAFAIIHPFSGVNNRYIYHYFRSAPFIFYVEKQMIGVAYPAINDGKFFSGLLPLPPLNEQKRIVEQVDRLLALCDDLEKNKEKRIDKQVSLNNASLEKLLSERSPEDFQEWWRFIARNFDVLYAHPGNVAKLKQAVLQLAVMGKLVPQDPGDESASVLLEKIRKEKDRLIKAGTIKKPKPLPPIKKEEIPYELPQGWAWTRLGTVSNTIEYGSSCKSLPGSHGIPILRMNNIQSGNIILDDLKYVSPNIKDLPRLYLSKNDILFNRTNSFELVGKTGIFTGEDKQYTFASYLIRISLFMDYIDSFFINMAMNSRYYRMTQIEPEITQQCGQANFNGTKLSNTLVPIAPVFEQRRIVQRVEELLDLCDRLEETLRKLQSTSRQFCKAAKKEG